MAVFYSFHYRKDAWRVQQIMNMGKLEGQPLLNSQQWEAVKAKGDAAVRRYIEDNMKYKTAVVVLVGSETADRRWVRYEIAKAWDDRKPLVGIRIHGLADAKGNTDTSGSNPFSSVTLQGGGNVGQYVTLHNPAGGTSQAVYNSIKDNINTWVDAAYKRG